MPNRQLTQQDNFETIITWLNENLSNPFMAQMQSLPIDDNNRGIYFWFTQPEGYQRLSSLGLNITAINPGYSKVVDGEIYHLVYLGTAGTGKKGNSNIINRLNWHLKTAHQENDVCSGFLSTLRQTVGAALSDDLINNNTGKVVSTFFSDFFYLCTLPYLGDSNTKSIIDEDEHCLITTIKPLFNIKNNPNARITAGQHPTRQLKVRRGLVMYKTRERLGCMKGDKGIANHQENDNKPPESPINNYEIISEHNGCIEFTVTKEQSIHEVVSGIDGLPAGKCEIFIYNSVNPDEFLYASEKNGGKRITGRSKINIYGYFKNPDTNKNSQPRWKLIQQEMRDKEIEEITVRVCCDIPNETIDIENGIEKKSKVKQKENKINNMEIAPLIKNQFLEKLENCKKNNQPMLLILGCSNSKSRGGNAIQTNYFNSQCLNNKRRQTLGDYQQLIAANPISFDLKRNANQVNANYFGNCQNAFKEALDRYCTNKSIFYKPNQIALYRKKINQGKLHILILSGLYGVIKWDDKIIDYHLKFNSNTSLYNNDGCVLENIQEYITANNINDENVFYALSQSGGYLEMLTNAKPANWSYLWIKGDRGHSTASFLLNHLPGL